MNVDQKTEADGLTRTISRVPDRENLVRSIVKGELKIINGQDMKRISDIFAKMDYDRSRMLTMSDFERLARVNNANVEHALSFFRQVLTKMDFNHDGEISEEEFLRYFVISALFDAKLSRVPAISTNTVSGDIFLLLFDEFRSAFKSKVWDFENLMNEQ